jgi:hypothetical protein
VWGDGKLPRISEHFSWGLQRYEAGKVIGEETEIVVEVSYGN